MDENLLDLDNSQEIRRAALVMMDAATAIRVRSGSIRTSWQALGALYHAPEQSLVLTAMDKPVESATTLEDRTGEVGKALGRYADRIDELEAQRSQLLADITAHNAADAAYQRDQAGWRDPFGFAERDLMSKGEDLQARIDAWASAVDAAQNECANAIRAMYGAPALKFADRATVEEIEAGLASGLSPEGWNAKARAGDVPWKAPEIWNGHTPWGKANALVNGVGDWVSSTAGAIDVLARGGEPGQRDAMLSHLKQLGGDVVSTAVAGQLARSGADPFAFQSPDQLKASSERLTSVAKGAVSWDNWGTSGWRTAGSLLPDAAMAAMGIGAVKTAASGALRGTLRTSLSGLTRLAPTTSARVADLASAMKVAGAAKVAAGMAKVDVILDTPNVTKALTTARNANYARVDLQKRVADAPAKAAAAVQSGARSAGSALRTGGRTAADAAVDAFRPVLPRVEYAGIPATRTAPQVDRFVGALAKTTDEAKGLINTSGWATRLQDAAEPARPGSLARAAYEGDPGTGMLGKPPAVTDGIHKPLQVDIKGDYAELMPRARQTFGETNLVRLAEDLGIKDAGKLANARIEVRGRGVFYTQDGEVVFVEATRRNINLRGMGISREIMSTDLRNPLPNRTYLVDNNTFFHTNAAGQADHIHIADIGKVPAGARSAVAQANITRGSEEGVFDAGHVQAREFGGAREEINMARMYRDFNRGAPGRTAAAGDSWRDLERIIARNRTDGTTTAVDIRLTYPRAADVQWQPGRTITDANRPRLAPTELKVRERTADGAVRESWTMENTKEPCR